jgi:ribosomal protein S18 acetylase RimI-like enzyme
MVYKTNFSSEQLYEKIEGIIQYFTDLKLPFIWFTGDQTKPSNLPELLVSEYNFKQITNPGMYFKTKHLKEIEEIENLEIIRVDTKEQLDDWVCVFMESFKMRNEELKDFFPHWLEHKNEESLSTFIGYFEGKAASISAVCYGVGVAGIYCVGTIKEARRKGIGTAVTLTAIKEAKERGYEIVILHSSEMGYNAYKRMGFEEICKVNMLVWNTE